MTTTKLIPTPTEPSIPSARGAADPAAGWPAGPPTRPGTPGVIVTLATRRLALTIRSPRAFLVPLLAPLLFAMVVAPGLADSVNAPGGRTAYMTVVALSGAGLLIPLNCLFSGLGVVVDRQQGALRELLVAPIRRSAIVFGNLVATLSVTALQVAVLVGASALRGADFRTSGDVLWFLGAAVLFAAFIGGLAEILATKIDSAEEYTGAVPAIAVVPFFFAGTLYPISSLPAWLTAVAKVLPLTHAIALFRYGITPNGGRALHDIWGMNSLPAMAAMSLGVVALYAIVAVVGALRLFARAGTG